MDSWYGWQIHAEERTRALHEMADRERQISSLRREQAPRRTVFGLIRRIAAGYRHVVNHTSAENVTFAG